MHTDVDVVVVGAGLAGLRAAGILVGAGLSVRVLEARDRVGGRTHTVDVAGVTIDHGGQWIGPTQRRVVALADRFGVERFESGIEFPLDREGRYSYELGGRIARPAGLDELPISVEQRDQVRTALAELERLTATVPAERPWETPDAGLWDSITVESWIAETIPDDTARIMFRSLTMLDLSAEAAELSMLGLMFDGATSEMSEDPERWRIVGGAQQLSQALAAGLADRVVLGAPVVGIDWRTPAPVVFVGPTDEPLRRVTARRVVVALPPQLAGRLDYAPAMPAERDGLTSRYPSTSVIKCHAVYDRPFWRDHGLNGWGVLPDDDVLDVFGDNSVPGSDAGVLVGFIQRRNATRLGAATPADRRAAVLATFARVLGDASALTPLAYVEADWAAERYSRGCFQCHPTPNTWVHFGRAWREPVGPIHWAASEYSHEWYGFMEGALASAERTAEQIIEGLERA